MSTLTEKHLHPVSEVHDAMKQLNELIRETPVTGELYQRLMVALSELQIAITRVMGQP